jgi:hypothetical protein
MADPPNVIDKAAQCVGGAVRLEAQAPPLLEVALDERCQSGLHTWLPVARVTGIPGHGSATSIRLRLSSLA